MKTIGVLTPSGAVDEKALAGGIAYWKTKDIRSKNRRICTPKIVFWPDRTKNAPPI